MGQHTWFVKDAELYLHQQKLYSRLNDHDEGLIYLDEDEIIDIDNKIDEIDENNEAEYHDLFRTGKRNEDGTYIDDEFITSREQCFEWINNPDNKVSFSRTMFDTEEQIKTYKKQSMKRLNEFWDKYPNGLIHFG